MLNLLFRRLAALIVISVVLIACQGPAEQTPTPSFPSPTETPIKTPPQVLTPSPQEQNSPTPGSPLVLLVAPETAELSLVNELEAILAELAAAEDVRFETVSTLSTGQLTSDVVLVVAVPPDPGLQEIAVAEPGIQFLGINIPGLETNANLSAIGPDGGRPDQLGFLAGYTAAVATPEWRVGALTVSDSAGGIAVRDGFLNGVVFFCGLCQQIYPPYNQYPLYLELPADASSNEWQSAADALITQAVETIYVAPGAEQEELLTHLATAGVNIIGNQPPPQSAQNRWVASIGVDFAEALRTAWPELIAGMPVGQLSARPEIYAANSDLLSPGRQMAVEAILPDLQTGYIDTGVGQDGPDTSP